MKLFKKVVDIYHSKRHLRQEEYTPDERRIDQYLQQEQYTPDERREVIEKLRNVDEETRQAFLKWCENGELPTEPIHGVNVSALVEHREMKPPTAFLAADWMGRDPEAASRMLSRGYDAVIADEALEIPDDLKEIVEQLERAEAEGEAPDDDSDPFRQKPDGAADEKEEE